MSMKSYTDSYHLHRKRNKAVIRMKMRQQLVETRTWLIGWNWLTYKKKKQKFFGDETYYQLTNYQTSKAPTKHQYLKLYLQCNRHPKGRKLFDMAMLLSAGQSYTKPLSTPFVLHKLYFAYLKLQIIFANLIKLTVNCFIKKVVDIPLSNSSNPSFRIKNY